MSWILSSKDSTFLDEVGEVSLTDVVKAELLTVCALSMGVTGLLLDTGVNGENVLAMIWVFRLLDLRGKAGINGGPGRSSGSRCSSFVFSLSGSTSREGEASGLSSEANAVGRSRTTSEASSSATAVCLRGDSAPVSCLKALDGVLSGDSGIADSISQLALLLSTTRLSWSFGTTSTDAVEAR